ncbi:hypothetical protein [Herpetosiphon llansteffanensis]|uniref:hypothetical protein n=1 Tax=Herpetosiphon llansteffanensis TaxID=2094568 RepID=UPI000D7D16F1|nr:hypothetical protein [Herpetosiphon llansteffanensis]
MLTKFINGYQRWAWIPWFGGVGLIAAGLNTLRQPLQQSTSSYSSESQPYLAWLGIGILIVLIIVSGITLLIKRMRFAWDLVWMCAALLMLCGVLSWSGTRSSLRNTESSRSHQRAKITLVMQQQAAWFIVGGAACILITSWIIMLEPASTAPSQPEHSHPDEQLIT